MQPGYEPEGVSSTTSYPLSHYQRGIWLGAQSRPNGGEFNMVYPLRIRSPLDISALKQALQQLVDRHALLRTIYPIQQGAAVAVVQPQQVVAFKQVDGAQWSQDKVRQWAAGTVREPYDLATGPLFRVDLLTCASDDHLLLLMGHHIILDMISWWTLLEELVHRYSVLATGGLATGKAVPLPPLGKAYHDFVAWHHAELDAKADRLARYWQRQLADAPAVLELPTDRPRPTVRAFHGATTTFCLPDELSACLRRLAETNGATLYTTLLAAYQVLLSRLSGQTDLIVGTPFATRPGRAFQQTVGLFADLVPLRANLAGNPTFRTFLQQVSQTVVGALVHQTYPFYQLLETLNLKQDPSYTPLFQTTFQLERADRAGFAELLSGAVAHQMSWGGLQVETFPVSQQEGRTDLAMILYDNGQSIFGTLLYDPDLFDADTVQRFIGHFQTLLQAIATDPEQAVARLPLLTPAERHQLLVEWNATVADYPHESCFHQLFEAQVVRTPDAVALSFGEQQLTYRELNARANQVAHVLMGQGVGPEIPVALYLERSLEMAVALLGVLKAGGAYVPLDLTYPPERLNFMLTDAQVKIFLTQAELAAQLPAVLAAQLTAQGIQQLCIESSTICRASRENPVTAVHPNNLAYIIYTSGSTGLPKGVLIEHQGLANLVEMELRTFQPQPGDRVLQFASFGFDASVWDLIMAWMSGATLYIAPQEARLSATVLAELMRREHITMATLTPSMLALLSPTDFPDLTVVTATGEACPAEIVARWAPTVRFFNGYGPTEATVGATLGECFADNRKPHIGRPFLNKQIYLLDDHLQPVPVGVPGALFIGGVGLARGYLNRPELTATAFIDNPFGPKAHPGKLYRTGDYARYRPDGTIDFLGRLDHQVQIRGLRIELGKLRPC